MIKSMLYLDSNDVTPVDIQPTLHFGEKNTKPVADCLDIIWRRGKQIRNIRKRKNTYCWCTSYLHQLSEVWCLVSEVAMPAIHPKKEEELKFLFTINRTRNMSEQHERTQWGSSCRSCLQIVSETTNRQSGSSCFSFFTKRWTGMMRSC